MKKIIAVLLSLALMSAVTVIPSAEPVTPLPWGGGVTDGEKPESVVPDTDWIGDELGNPFIEGDYMYYLTEGGTKVMIAQYNGSEPDVVIPSTISGRPVTSIRDCSSFGLSRSTVSLTIPATLTDIGEGTLYQWESLEHITVADGNPVYHSDGNCLIETASKTLVLGCQTSVIPSDGSVTRIGAYAFSWQLHLTDIIIPAGVTEIGDGAFESCRGLTSVILPDGVAHIGNSAFEGCLALAEIAVPDSAVSIGAGAFDYTQWYDRQPNGLLYIGKVAYGYKGGFCTEKTIELREDTLGLAGGAFARCGSITSLTLPDSLVYIGDGAFTGCGFLTELTIPNGVTHIGKGAFIWCDNLTKLTLPKGLTEVEEGWFGKCPSLTNLTIDDANPRYYCAGNCLIETKTGTLTIGCAGSVIPNDGSVTRIGGKAFTDNTGPESLVIPGSVTEIEDGAFRGCRGPARITVSDGLMKIGSNAFDGCDDLTEIALPDSLTEIGEWAFASCRKLTQMTVPDGVTVIGKGAFYGCEALLRITLPAGLTEMSESLLFECDSLKSVTVPQKTEIIHQKAVWMCGSLTRIYIPAGVTLIEPGAFYLLRNLTTVYYGGTEEDRDRMVPDPRACAALMNATWVFEADGLPTLAGDADGDGQVTMKDVLLTRKSIAGLFAVTDAEASDANGDGSVDMKDVLTMRKMIAA